MWSEPDRVDHPATLAQGGRQKRLVCSDCAVNSLTVPDDSNSVIVVLGPTGVGKSELSLALAHELNGEVVNADSMQLYRGMDIGTAKLLPSQREGVRHHVIDVWDLDHVATVAEYQKLARTAIAEIQARGRVPILVGGSGLYINSAVDDMNFPGTDPRIRQRWESELDRIGPEALHDVLSSRDPVAAARMEPRNGRRIVRALEVIEITGEPYNAGLGVPKAFIPTVRIGLRRPRAELDELIANRVDRMWQQGWVDEVRDLLERGLAQAPTASRALGYAQIAAYLAGECDEETAREVTTTATRRFVRRQHSWFDRDERINWLEIVGGDQQPTNVLNAALSLIS